MIAGARTGEVAATNTLGNLMPEIARVIFHLLIVAALTGCVNYPPEYPDYSDATEHYRDVDRFDRIAVLVSTNGMGGADPSFSENVKKEIGSYLEQNGIEFVSKEGNSSDQSAILELLISRNGESIIINASLRTPDGTVVEETPLFHKAATGPSTALAQQIASLTVDDLILLWYPAAAAGAERQSKTTPAKFAILMNEVEPQSIGGVTRLSWEAFPSQRLLEGSGLSSSEISDVTYEVRVHKASGRLLYSQRYRRSGVYRQSQIVNSGVELPFLLPSCEYIVWSVRAHFTLADHQRVTEWAGDYTTSYDGLSAWPTLPPYMHRRTTEQDSWNPMYQSFPLEHHVGGGARAYIEPPNSIKCEELERGGILAKDRKLATANFEEPLESLLPGESIGAMATVRRTCRSDECDFEEGIEDASSMMTSCLASEFGRRSLDIPIINLSETLPNFSVPEGNESVDPGLRAEAIGDSENQERLAKLGIRYLLSMDIVVSDLGTRRTTDVNEGLFFTSKSTTYTARIATAVYDAGTGDLLGTITSRDSDSKGGTMMFALFLPIMYIPDPGSISGIQKDVCDSIVRRMSFMLRGGVSTGWPDDLFNSIHEPLWATE